MLEKGSMIFPKSIGTARKGQGWTGDGQTVQKRFGPVAGSTSILGTDRQKIWANEQMDGKRLTKWVGPWKLQPKTQKKGTQMFLKNKRRKRMFWMQKRDVNRREWIEDRHHHPGNGRGCAPSLPPSLTCWCPHISPLLRFCWSQLQVSDQKEKIVNLMWKFHPR